MPVTFKLVESQEELIKCFLVRGIVFLEEQHVSHSLEMDEHEYSVLHFLGQDEMGEPIAASRLRFVEGWAKLERIAVRKKWRGQGYGKKIIRLMLSEGKKRGFSNFKMNAQAHLVEFYRQFGFEPQGEIFMEANIEHILMTLK